MLSQTFAAMQQKWLNDKDFFLVFIGTKMLIVDVWKVPTGLSLGMVAVLIGGSLVASRLIPPAEANR